MAGRGRECVARVKRLKPRPRLPSLPLPPTRAIYKTFIHLAAISDALCLVQLGEYSLQLSQPLGNALYVCSDANWSGTCENVGFNNEECIVFPGELQNDITSVGPPQGYYCYLYR